MFYIPQMSEAQTVAAAQAQAWTTDPAATERLGCIYCMDVAEESALENGAQSTEAVAWAASYLSQGDSFGCDRHSN